MTELLQSEEEFVGEITDDFTDEIADMENRDSLVWWIAPVVVMPIFVGYLIGWLIGASQTPVVATALPLLFGLAGALSYHLVERKVVQRQITQALHTLEVVKSLDEPVRAQMASELKQHIERPVWLPTLWSGGILLFCIFCFLGLQDGIRRRVPQYPSLNVLLSGIEITPEERAELERFRRTMQSQGVSESEFKEIVQTICVPILTGDLHANKEKRLLLLTDCLWRIESNGAFSLVAPTVHRVPYTSE